MPQITDTQIKKTKATDKPLRLYDGHGLYLEIRPNGSRYWRMKYRFAGRPRLLALGVYPVLGLADARAKTLEARRQIADGIDPGVEKQKRKLQLAAQSNDTFAAVAREWHEKNIKRWSEGHASTLLNRLERDAFPFIGAIPVAQLTAVILLQALRRVEKRGANELAHRLGQIIAQVLRYAVATGRITASPVNDLRGALAPVVRGHFTALQLEHLPEFLAKLERNEARLYPLTRHALKLLLLTFVRTSELINARWSEIDLERALWTIPAERMKMRREHIVPLSRQAVAVLRSLEMFRTESGFVLPSATRANKGMSNGTILMALKRMGYKGKATGHGFRALALSTIKQELGYRHEVPDRQLAHYPSNKVDRAYDRAAFIAERTKMMQEWADYLDGLIGRKP